MQARHIFTAGAVIFFLFSPAAVFADEKISEAEILLFETNHLKTITKPEKLHYIFIRSGTLEPNFHDNVEISIDKVMPDGGKTVTTEFLSGSNKVNYPPMEDVTGNPVLLWFLERDIHEMQRITGGKSPFFRRRIRLALADHAEVHPVKIAYDGKEMDAKEIKISPYVNDEVMKERAATHIGKYYLFVLSEGIPGEIYQLRSVDPDSRVDKSGKVSPLIEETLTFSPDENRAAR
jgi:hypothetical protein